MWADISGEFFFPCFSSFVEKSVSFLKHLWAFCSCRLVSCQSQSSGGVPKIFVNFFFKYFPTFFKIFNKVAFQHTSENVRLWKIPEDFCLSSPHFHLVTTSLDFFRIAVTILAMVKRIFHKIFLKISNFRGYWLWQIFKLFIVCFGYTNFCKLLSWFFESTHLR